MHAAKVVEKSKGPTLPGMRRATPILRAWKDFHVNDYRHVFPTLRVLMESWRILENKDCAYPYVVEVWYKAVTAENSGLTHWDLV